MDSYVTILFMTRSIILQTFFFLYALSSAPASASSSFDSTRSELERLKNLSSQVNLQMPREARQRLAAQSPESVSKQELAFIEDEISLAQAAPVRSGQQRALVQEDFDLEGLELESFEQVEATPQRASDAPRTRRFRGR